MSMWSNGNSLLSLVGCEDFLVATKSGYEQSAAVVDEGFRRRCDLANEHVQRRQDDRLKHFQIGKWLGSGRFAEVRQLLDRRSNVTYALKLMHRNAFVQQKSICLDAERDILFTHKSEWFPLAHACWWDDQRVYFAMENVSGGDLLKVAETYFGGRLPEEAVRFYGAELTEAVHCLHRLGYVHRDVKPENILIGCDGHIKLADFGSAVKLDEDGMSDLTYGGGNAEYTSPELLSCLRGGADIRYGVGCDFWSLGVVLYELLYGRTPFHAENALLLFSNIWNSEKSLSFSTEHPISSELQNLIVHLLQSSVAERYTYDNIRNHTFFATVSWSDLKQSESRMHCIVMRNLVDIGAHVVVLPPYIPATESAFADFVSDPKFNLNQPRDTTHTGSFSVQNRNDFPLVGFTFWPPDEDVGFSCKRGAVNELLQSKSQECVELKVRCQKRESESSMYALKLKHAEERLSQKLSELHRMTQERGGLESQVVQLREDNVKLINRLDAFAELQRNAAGCDAIGSVHNALEQHKHMFEGKMKQLNDDVQRYKLQYNQAEADRELACQRARKLDEDRSRYKKQLTDMHKMVEQLKRKMDAINAAAADRRQSRRSFGMQTAAAGGECEEGTATSLCRASIVVRIGEALEGGDTATHLMNGCVSSTPVKAAMQGDIDKMEVIFRELGGLAKTKEFLEDRIADLEAQLRRSESVCAELQVEKKNRDTEIEKLQSRLADKDKTENITYISLLDDLSKVKEQKADLRLKMRELERNNAVLSCGSASAEKAQRLVLAELEALRQQLHDKKEEIHKLKESTDNAAHSEIALLRSQLVCKTQELETLRTDAREREKVLEGKRRDAEQRLTETLVICRDLEGQLEDYDELRAHYKQQLASALEAQNDVSRTKESVEQSNANLSSQLRAKHLECESLAQRISALTLELEEKNAVWQTERQRLIDDIAVQRQRAEGYLEKLSSMGSDQGRLEITVQTGKRLMKELETDVERLTAECRSLGLKVDEERNGRLKFESGLLEALEKAERYKAQCQMLQAEMDDVDKAHAEEMGKEKSKNLQQAKLIEHLQCQLEATGTKKGGNKGGDQEATGGGAGMLSLERQKNAELRAEVKRLQHMLNQEGSLDSSISTGGSTLSLNSTLPNKLHAHKWKSNRVILPNKCLHCMTNITPGQTALKCSECKILVHVHCSGVCGPCAALAGGFRIDTPSPGPSKMGRMNGWVRLNKGDNWQDVWAVLLDGQLHFYTKPGTDGVPLESVELTRHHWQMAYRMEALPVCSEDDACHALEILLDEGSPGSKRWLFLAPTSEARDRWYYALQTFVNEQAAARSRSASEEQTLAVQQVELLRLDEPCQLQIQNVCIINDKMVLACDSGLYWRPTDGNDIPVAVRGLDAVHQVDTCEYINAAVLICGERRALFATKLSDLLGSLSTQQLSGPRLTMVHDMTKCLLFRFAIFEGRAYLAVVFTGHMELLLWNDTNKSFNKHKQHVLEKPFSCLLPCEGFLLVGTDRFTQVHLTTGTCHAFIDPKDVPLKALFDTARKHSDRPVNAVSLASTALEGQELLLATRTFGVVVSTCGLRTRSGEIRWQSTPLHVTVCGEFMAVSHETSVEIFSVPNDARLPYAVQVVELGSPRIVGNNAGLGWILIACYSRAASTDTLLLAFKLSDAKRRLAYTGSIKRIKIQ